MNIIHQFHDRSVAHCGESAVCPPDSVPDRRQCRCCRRDVQSAVMPPSDFRAVESDSSTCFIEWSKPRRLQFFFVQKFTNKFTGAVKLTQKFNELFIFGMIS